MSAKPESRWATPAGSCIASNTVSSLMAKCPATKPLVHATIPSIHFSLKLALANTFPGLCLLISNQRWSVRLACDINLVPFLRVHIIINVSKNMPLRQTADYSLVTHSIGECFQWLHSQMVSEIAAGVQLSRFPVVNTYISQHCNLRLWSPVTWPLE